MMELTEFWKDSEDNDEGKHFQYYVEFLFLLSDLCLDRNYCAIDILNKMEEF